MYDVGYMHIFISALCSFPQCTGTLHSNVRAQHVQCKFTCSFTICKCLEKSRWKQRRLHLFNCIHWAAIVFFFVFRWNCRTRSRMHLSGNDVQVCHCSLYKRAMRASDKNKTIKLNIFSTRHLWYGQMLLYVRKWNAKYDHFHVKKIQTAHSVPYDFF